MRYLLYILALVVLAVAVGVAGQLYLSEPLLVRYGEWSAEPPMSLALAAVIAGLICGLLLLRLLAFLLFLPAKVGIWRRARQVEKLSQLRGRVLRENSYGNRRTMLKHLAELAPMDDAAAWQAAAVAEELGDVRAQGKYLRRAAEAEDKVIAAAAKAKLSLRDNHLTEAEQLLAAAAAPRGAALLAELYYEVAQKRGEHKQALAAAMILREDCPAKFAPLVADTIRRQLHSAKDAAEVAAFWRDEVGSADKKTPELVALHLRALWQLGDEKGASDGLGAALRQHGQHEDILRLVVEFGSTAQCEAAFKESEKRAAGAEAGNAGLLTVLAELAEKLQLPGKARLYGQRLAALQVPRAETE